MACNADIINIAHDVLATSTTRASERFNAQMDQAAANATNGWTVDHRTPNFMSAQAQRLASESGSGMTRYETNQPRPAGQ